MSSVARLKPRSLRGASMIEVLVTMVIIAFGLLGMAGLQVRMQASEMESYQRSQALLLLNDMANRMATNRTAVLAGSYAIASTSPVGTGMTCALPGTPTTVQRDIYEWCMALQGAGEVKGGAKVGAMIGGRGCIEAIGGGDYMLTVAWLGLTPISAPPEAVACGVNNYDTASSPCVSDLCRRAVTTVVRIATLI